MDKNRRFFSPGMHAALIVFAVVILAMFTVFSYAQYYLGMWGLLITELGILIIALVGMRVFNVNFRVAVPIRRPKFRQIAGTLFVWAGAFIIVLLSTVIMFYFFPEGIDTGTELTEFVNSWPVVPAILLVSVAPAICEEMLHRGFLMNCVWSTVRSRIGTCIIVGVLFGINHLDPYRFLATSLLGGFMAYVLYETNNFLYNMLFHFANNFFIEVISVFAANEEASQMSVDTMTDMMPMALASYLVIGCIAPLLLLSGVMMIKGLEKVRAWGTTKIVVSIVIAVAIAALMFMTGSLMMFSFVLDGSFDELLSEAGQAILVMP